MPLYACSRCDGYDNTALTNFHQHRREARAVGYAFDARCSICDPNIGRWHDVFPRRTRAEAGLTITDEQGFLWTPEQWRRDNSIEKG